MGRILADFEDRRWIDRDGSTDALEPLGRFVADRFLDLQRSLGTEGKLREVWPWLPREMPGFGVDLFADAVVSHPGPGYPFAPVERMEQLIETTGNRRGFGTIVLEAGSMEPVCGAVLGGTAMEYVFAPHVLRAALDWDPDRIAEVAPARTATSTFTSRCPTSSAAASSSSTTASASAVTTPRPGRSRRSSTRTPPEAVAWATDVVERYRDEATPVGTDGPDGAVGNRDVRYSYAAPGMWEPDEPRADEFREWVREAGTQLRPFSTGGTYVNFQTAEDGEERVRATYGDNYDRLVEVKTAYDPDNRFRVNRNVRPRVPAEGH